MSNDHDSVERWHDAAALATFPIYEASNGSERWAGGFSSDGSHIEVIALVGGHEVSVATSLVEDDAHDTVRRRLVVGELLWHHVLEHDDELELPHSVTIEAEDRAVTVDGEPLTVSGMRIGHDGRWVGTARLGDVTVKINTDSSAPLSLRTCLDRSSMAEFPPAGH